MSRARLAGAAALGLAVVLGLSGCFGPGEEELVARAAADFDAIVEQAAAAELDVLYTLEVEKPVSESCDPETDAEHTVFVAAGTTAIQATPGQELELVAGLQPPAGSDDEERWTEVDGLPKTQRAYLDADGITAAVRVDSGLLVITVFSPCR